ncbi:DEAD/DEAH box helicase [Sphingomonas sp. TX0543]|nr:DEAD/DEAH box helicase [Sphingomonas sp. 3P27F8]
MSFSALGLTDALVRALDTKGYETPTPIQRDAIPIVLTGRDLLGIAQTGTGKTAAFVLPSIQRLAEVPKKVLPTHCRMLVLAPTRELASQIADNARGYARNSNLSVATVFGGTSINKNKHDLMRGVDILVATPGRLIDLVEQGYCNLSMLEILVLDEADQMLDLGFIHALRKIVRMVPRRRQTLFFSATMPSSIRELAGQFLHDPETVSVVPAATTAERVDQYVTLVNQQEKQALLTILLTEENIDRALVFTRTKHGADRVVRLLAGNGIAANAIHGNKSQPQRERALVAFKSGEVPILVATDIAARGIDISGVSHVFNFELPNVPEQYVHRIGRTARAGASGIAISFCADDERPYLRDIEKVTRQRVPMRALPADFLKRAEALKAARVRVAGPDPAPREDRPRAQRGPARPKASHHPVATRDYSNASRRGTGGRGGGGGGGGGRNRGRGRGPGAAAGA